MHMCVIEIATEGDSLRPGLLLLFFPQRKETDTRDLDDLEADTGDITLGLTPSTEPRDQHLVVLIDKVQAAIVWNESSDFLSVLDELNTNTFSDGRVRLFSLDPDFFQHNSFCV